MTTLEIPRPDTKEREPNGINRAGDAYRRAAEGLRAAGSTLPLTQLIILDMQYGRRRSEPVPGTLPATQNSIDLMRGSTESSIGMDYGDSRRHGILAACRAAMDVIQNDGNCIISEERSTEQCLRYGAALLALQGTPVSIQAQNEATHHEQTL